MFFKNTVKNISSLKVQGAENIAKAAISALIYMIKKSKSKSRQQFITEISKSAKELKKTRITEPLMRNCLDHIMNAKGESLEFIKKSMVLRGEELLEKLDHNVEYIAKVGSKLIKDGMIVYTHCHSRSVVSLLVTAKKSGKRFVVNNTETRPNFQGRKTAEELAAEKIKVNYFVDAAFVEAIKEANIIFLGADALTKDGIYNKVGSSTVVMIAHKYNIPVYICADSMKFDPISENIEERNPIEVWKRPPVGVIVRDPVFERIDYFDVIAVISELGIIGSDSFLEKMK